MGNIESDATVIALRENLQDLQDLVIRQTSRLINNNLYTKSLLSSFQVRRDQARPFWLQNCTKTEDLAHKRP